MLSVKVNLFRIKGIRTLMIPISTVRCSSKHHPGTRYDERTFMRTNVLADYIDKLTNDINMVALTESDDDEFQCKHIAMMNCVIIIGILIFMFIDMNTGGNKDSEDI